MLPHNGTSDATGTLRPLPAALDDLRALQLNDGERRRMAPSRRPRRWLRWVLLLAVLGGGAYGASSWLPRWDSGVEVDATVFTPRSEGSTLLDLTGYLVPRKRITISPEVGGIITEVAIEEGMKVKKGDVLIQLHDVRFKAEYEQAKAALAAAVAQRDELKAGSRPEEIEQARAAYDQALANQEFLRGELARSHRSGIGVGVSRSDMDRNIKSCAEAEATVRNQKYTLRLAELGPRQEKIRAAEAEVERAQATLDKAKFYYERTRIVAPCDGTILERKAEVGEAVHPEVVVGALCVLANLNDMEAEADLQERDLPVLKQAQECQVVPDAYPDRSYRARFNRLQPQVNRQRGVVKIRVSVLEPDDALLPDMNCRILFANDHKSPSQTEPTLIPERARAREGEDWVTYVFDKGVARRRVLDCGRVIGDSVQVKSGLKHGDVVLMAGSQPLHEGMAVRPRLKAPSGPAAGQKER